FAQILTNLIMNSLIHGFAESSKGRIVMVVKLEDAGMLNIHYRDNGIGIPEEHRSSVFEPFFTTNKQNGTGLGMHIVRNIVVQKLKGKISVDPSHTPGAGFHIRLPIVEKEGIFRHG
ncbi:MAG: hypothetical protein GF344_00630, partial [Chitinivibrionales bacterium]|nr:hypothetical protein [Chitinivibrionales bacterium]MBD3355626.1 hypothetical protein [Chitinivibrionales bacterium]